MNIHFDSSIPLQSKRNKRDFHQEDVERGHYLYYLDSTKPHTNTLNISEYYRCQGPSVVGIETTQCGRMKGGRRCTRIIDANNMEVSRVYRGQHFCQIITSNQLINRQASQQYIFHASQSAAIAPHAVYIAMSNSLRIPT